MRFHGFTDPWNSINFNNLFTYIPNNTLSRADLNYDAGDYKNVHYGDVLIKFGPVLDAASDELPFITDASTKKLGSMVLMDGDVIIADTAEDEAVGKATEIINVGDQQIVSGLHTIACRPAIKMVPTYLGFYLNAEAYHKQLYALMQGVKVLSISKSNIEDTVIRYPTSPEQTRICDLLNLLEARIARTHKIIEHLKKYKRGAFKSIFTPTRMDCEWVSLEELCDVITKGTTPKEFSTTGSIKFIKIESIIDGCIVNEQCKYIDIKTHNGALSRSKLQAEDILFSIAGSLGICALVKDENLPANTNQALSIIRLKPGIQAVIGMLFITHNLVDGFTDIDTTTL